MHFMNLFLVACFYLAQAAAAVSVQAAVRSAAAVPGADNSLFRAAR